MKQNKATKLAYAAGIVDGEGCISIYSKSIRNGQYKGILKNYHLTVVVTQKDGKLVDWLFGNFGGSVSLHKKWERLDEKCWMHEWTLNYQNASRFLKQILPFLIIKKKQAEIAIRFQDRLGYGKKLSEHELELREKFYQEIRSEKTKYTFSNHPNVQRRVSSENAIVQL